MQHDRQLTCVEVEVQWELRVCAEANQWRRAASSNLLCISLPACLSRRWIRESFNLSFYPSFLCFSLPPSLSLSYHLCCHIFLCASLLLHHFLHPSLVSPAPFYSAISSLSCFHLPIFLASNHGGPPTPPLPLHFSPL